MIQIRGMEEEQDFDKLQLDVRCRMMTELYEDDFEVSTLIKIQ